LLKDCGISFDNGKDQLKAVARNFPMEVFYLRNGDIPQYLRDGVIDIAIIGENLLVEKGEGIDITEKLGFSKCKVSFAVPKDDDYDGMQSLNGKKIATSYPNTVKKYLKKAGVSADLHIINGSVEIAPNIGLSDAICDIVSSGSTLFKNNLKEVEVLFNSEAVLASGPSLSAEKQALLDKLQFRIQSVLKGRKSKYILMNVPNEGIEIISSILPVLKSPTVMPLAEPGWSSLHSVINEGTFWDVIDQLKAAGAQDILVCPVEKMVL
jgi:ATP phosphoribosyltransferase